jgi:6-phosphogluconolactonase
MMHEFNTKEELFSALCNQVVADLQQAIEKKGKATLLLSGGSTPKPLFLLLNQVDLDWKKVTIGLVDERFIANTSEFSNENLLVNNLLINKAKSATLVPMVFHSGNQEKNLQLASVAYTVFEKATVVLLGMGDDGHTASIFPNDAASELACKTTDILANTNAPNHPTNRITCTTHFLKKAKKTYLLITGESKKQVLAVAEENNFPINQFKDTLTAIYFAQ